MRHYTRLLVILVTAMFAYNGVQAETHVMAIDVDHTNVNLRGAPLVLATPSIQVSEAGAVLVEFDGYCVSSPGDRIVLAASDGPNWSANNGSVFLKAEDSNVDRIPFSHSRLYGVSPGLNTFYAVAENAGETAGTGMASIYGTIVLKFYGNSADVQIAHKDVNRPNVDLRGAPIGLDTLDLVFAEAGEVLVRFNGYTVSDVFDNIVIAAGDGVSWGVNEGNVSVISADSTNPFSIFSHARRYAVSAGSRSFYAVAENFGTSPGSGVGSIYGSLSVEYFPNSSGDAVMEHSSVVRTRVNVRGAPFTMAQTGITAPANGTALVRYEGAGFPAFGDRIAVAASDSQLVPVQPGRVELERTSPKGGFNFAHSRAYPVTPGPHTFYAMCENVVEQGGNGEASSYGCLSVIYYPNPIPVSVDETGLRPSSFSLDGNYPNPFNPSTSISYTLDKPSDVNLSVYDALGRRVTTLVSVSQPAGEHRVFWRSTDEQGNPVGSGVYFYRLATQSGVQARKMLLLR